VKLHIIERRYVARVQTWDKKLLDIRVKDLCDYRDVCAEFVNEDQLLNGQRFLLFCELGPFYRIDLRPLG
jgi:hypothetical protein